MKCSICGLVYRKNGMRNGKQKWRKMCDCNEYVVETPITQESKENMKNMETIYEEEFEYEVMSQSGIKRTYVMSENSIRTLQKLKLLYPIKTTYDIIINDAVKCLYKELSK